MHTIDELRREFQDLCRKLDVERPLHSTPQHDGSVHVEVSENWFYYVVTERGKEFQRKSTTQAKELLYWLMRDVVFDLASAFEARHRVKGQSFRRLLFRKELELFAQIDPDWAARRQAEIEVTLHSHPYDDEVES